MLEFAGGSIVAGLWSFVPVKIAVGVTLGLPIVLASANLLSYTFLRGETSIGRQTLSWIFRGSPIETLQSLLALGKIFTLGVLCASAIAFQTKVWIAIALIVGALISGFLS